MTHSSEYNLWNIVGNLYLKKFSESTLYRRVAEMCAAQRYAGYLLLNFKHLHGGNNKPVRLGRTIKHKGKSLFKLSDSLV